MSAHHRTADWGKVTRTMRPRFQALINAGAGVCVDCGRVIAPGQRWQVGHIVSVGEGTANGWTRQMLDNPGNLGPSHSKGPGQRACNQIAGGKLGAAKVNASKRVDSRMLPW